MGFSEQLKKARIRKGFTQQQVADTMGVTNSTYCGYETGKRKPDVEKIKILANILDTSGDILLDIIPNAKKLPPSEDDTLTTEAQEVATAYAKAEPREQQIVRFTLKLPPKDGNV